MEQVQDLLRDDPCVSAMVQFRGDTVGNAGGINKRKRSGNALASIEEKLPFGSSILAVTVAAMCDASCSGFIRTNGNVP